ncbi:MAG: phosphotransferase family protein [Porticoccaceae bacterium]|nr:phosphotransferase family protein [Pseudomonadales bacterium]
MKPITKLQLTNFLTTNISQWKKAEIANLHRLPLGASRETYRFDVNYCDENGHTQTEKLILRRDPPASLVDSDRRHEYESYRAIYGHGIPVPKMILLEEDSSHFDGAISIAEDLRGFHNSEYQLQTPEWKNRLPHIAEQFWARMGQLAAIDIDTLELGFMRPSTRQTTAELELNYWADKLDQNHVDAEPITQAAIRFLRRKLPESSKLSMVHGDFRAGNFLYDDNGDIQAILDWEMSHIGDPLEDLAWSLNRTFCFGRDDNRSGLAPKAVALDIWQKASGIAVDPEALRWWEIFTCVKAQALWSSAAKVWQEGTNRDVIQCYAAWWLRNAQDKAILELMEQL